MYFASYKKVQNVASLEPKADGTVSTEDFTSIIPSISKNQMKRMAKLQRLV